MYTPAIVGTVHVIANVAMFTVINVVLCAALAVTTLLYTIFDCRQYSDVCVNCGTVTVPLYALVRDIDTGAMANGVITIVSVDVAQVNTDSTNDVLTELAPLAFKT